MFYAGDEIGGDDETSCPLEWAEQFYIADPDDLDDGAPYDPFTPDWFVS